MNAEQFLSQAKSIALTPAERALMKNALFTEIAGNAPRVPWNPLKVFTSAFAAVIILVGAGSGISYAAENSLPGDLLYPVKVNLTERVIASLQTSPDGVANYQAALVEKRLSEAASLLKKNALTDARKEVIRAYLKKSTERVQARLTELAETQKATEALALGADFESSLSAHDKELRSLQEQSHEGATVLADLLSDVSAARIDAEESIVNSENDRTDDAANSAFDALLEKIEKKLANGKANAQSDAAVGAIAEARSATGDRAAFVRNALRKAKEVEINITGDGEEHDDSNEIGARARIRVTEKKLNAMKEKIQANGNAEVNIDTETKIGGAVQLMNISNIQLNAGESDEAFAASKEALKQVQDALKLPMPPEMQEKLKESLEDLTN